MLQKLEEICRAHGKKNMLKVDMAILENRHSITWPLFFVNVPWQKRRLYCHGNLHNVNWTVFAMFLHKISMTSVPSKAKTTY